ncbi:MAG: GNAT family acetyltransferase [Pseudomonadales bacterium]|nr:GNAT family acetyltransferase [Pseudomonadales bacterium]MBO6702455.1 GNAT family acetyltransferase [Pseudomonadales bacterium]MBO7005849.1 GNAT family acetyltransferase [Pseudomonadales bacterium]
MHVRSFQESDRGDVVALWNSVFADDPPWNEPNTVIDTKLRTQPELFFVYESQEKVVGTLVAGFDGFRGWIHHVAVHPDHQGHGVSRLLIEAAESGLRELGCKKVNLQVRKGNEGAADKYRSMGFSDEPRISMGKLL